jgi:hypothetical protein
VHGFADGLEKGRAHDLEANDGQHGQEDFQAGGAEGHQFGVAAEQADDVGVEQFDDDEAAAGYGGWTIFGTSWNFGCRSY